MSSVGEVVTPSALLNPNRMVSSHASSIRPAGAGANGVGRSNGSHLLSVGMERPNALRWRFSQLESAPSPKLKSRESLVRVPMAVPCPFSKLHPQQKSWSLATQMRTETRSQFDSLQGRLGALGNQPTRSTIGFVGMSLSIVAGRIPLKASSIPLAIEAFRCRRLDNASRISTTLSQLPSPRALLHSSNNSKRRKEYTARCVTERPRQ
jgi:hypothetical protein